MTFLQGVIKWSLEVFIDFKLKKVHFSDISFLKRISSRNFKEMLAPCALEC